MVSLDAVARGIPIRDREHAKSIEGCLSPTLPGVNPPVASVRTTARERTPISAPSGHLVFLLPSVTILLDRFLSVRGC